VLCGTSVSSYFPNEVSGGAIFADGSWRIDRHTLCMLAFAAGQDCAGNLTNLPTPAAALVATVVPDGYAPAAPGGTSGPVPGVPVIAPPPTVPTADSSASTSDAIPVPGIVLWADGTGTGTGTTWFSISTQVLRGVSELTPDDLTVAMASARFGGPTAAAVTIGGRPGRLLSAGVGQSPSVRLTVVRADDVVVTISAMGLTAERVESIEAGLRPAG